MIQLKQVFGVLGMIAALAGIVLGNRTMIWVAMGLLGISIVLRIVLSASARRNQSAEETYNGESPPQ